MRVFFAGLLLPALLLAGGPSYSVDTVAGGEWAGDGLPARSASLGSPEGLATDASGALYISDSLDARVRKITPDGRISTVAGTGIRGFSGDGGPAAQARLDQPYGLAFGPGGLLYIADLGNGRVRRVEPDGNISTVAGGGEVKDPDGVPALTARLEAPRDLAFDRQGNLYISDFGGHRVYRVSPAGILTRFAGVGIPGLLGPVQNAPALLVPLNSPAGLAVDSFGRVYIADSGNGMVRVVFGGLLSTVPSTWDRAGQPVAIALDSAGALWVAGKAGGAVVKIGPVPETAAARPAVNEPRGLAFGPGGSLYIADVLPGAGGVVRTLSSRSLLDIAGDGTFRSPGDGRAPLLAHLDRPAAVAVGKDGAVYLAEAGGRIRKISGGVITTLATLDAPSAIAVDSAGAVWVAQRHAGSVTRIGAGGAPASYNVEAPEALASDPAGNVYVASAGGALWKFDSRGQLSTVARAAALCGVAAAPAGAVYVADPVSKAVYRVGERGALSRVAALETPGRITVTPDGAIILAAASLHGLVRLDSSEPERIAGTGIAGFSGDGGLALEAGFSSPADAACDAAGNLYVADTGNGRVRRLRPVAEPPEAVELLSITNAASMLSSPVVPGALMTIFGTGLGPREPLYGSLETRLGGYDVLFDGEPAPLLYLHSRQINLQAPYSVAGKSQVLIRVRKDGETILAIVAPVAASAPGVFTTGGAGHLAALNQDNTSNSDAQPAARGAVIVFWATGEGSTIPGGRTGKLASEPLPRPVLPVSVRIGGIPAEILYAGAAPGYAGLMQLNVRVPFNVSPGANSLELSVGGVSAQPGVTVSVR